MKTSQINKIFIKNLLQDDEIIQKKKKTMKINIMMFKHVIKNS